LTLAPALVGQLGWGVVPVTAVVTWGLFGIQEIGLMIEEPFRRALRLDIVTRTIYADVQETTYMPEWAKRGMLEKSQADEAKKAAEERLAAVLSGNATRVTGNFTDAPANGDASSGIAAATTGDTGDTGSGGGGSSSGVGAAAAVVATAVSAAAAGGGIPGWPLATKTPAAVKFIISGLSGKGTSNLYPWESAEAPDKGGALA
jgi:hypothetical protein